MTLAFAGASPLQAPFPGLRAFDVDEALLFYGRERHVIDLLDRLGDSRFVAVTGTSGSGKSSLVRAGLRPALQRGYLIDATTRWRFAVMRPGGAPIEALAHALVDALADSLHGQVFESIVRTLRTSSAGLCDVVDRAALPPGESLLVVADQFEELFRYDMPREQQGSAALFVSLLLDATEQRRVPIYVVMTMRSEFLGRCAEFAGLTEACNRSQYLVPRLTRDERQEAIVRPLRLFDTTPAPALVQQVLNDAGDDPDLLPVLQHVMLRTWREWQRRGAAGAGASAGVAVPPGTGDGRIDQSHYAAVGGIERALDLHGDEILSQLDPAGVQLTDRLFRSLTVVQNGVALRRPRRLRELYDVVGATTEPAQAAVRSIIQRFVERSSSFLTLSTPDLAPDTVVDITHESLIRKWRRLDHWVREEARSADWLNDLLRDVARRRDGDGSLWQDPELASVLRRRSDEQWTEAWANQYRRPADPAFAEVSRFLDDSSRAQSAAARSKQWQTAVRAMLAIAVVLILVGLYRLVVTQREVARLAAETKRVTEANQQASAQLEQLESERERLRQAAASPTATAEDKARLQDLQQQIEGARAQAKASQDELAKLKKDQQLSTADRGGLLKEIDSLRAQLTQVTNERDKLQADRRAVDPKSQSTQGATTGGSDAAGLTRQLEQEKARSADAAAEITRLRNENAALRAGGGSTNAGGTSASNASAQDLTKTFSDAVRAYDLKQWDQAIALMRDVVRMQAQVNQKPKEVRMSGTRFVPFSPQSYLAAAQFEAKSDCSSISPALAQASGEAIPPDVKNALQAAKARCPSETRQVR